MTKPNSKSAGKIYRLKAETSDAYNKRTFGPQGSNNPVRLKKPKNVTKQNVQKIINMMFATGNSDNHTDWTPHIQAELQALPDTDKIEVAETSFSQFKNGDYTKFNSPSLWYEILNALSTIKIISFDAQRISLDIADNVNSQTQLNPTVDELQGFIACFDNPIKGLDIHHRSVNNFLNSLTPTKPYFKIINEKDSHFTSLVITNHDDDTYSIVHLDSFPPKAKRQTGTKEQIKNELVNINNLSDTVKNGLINDYQTYVIPTKCLNNSLKEYAEYNDFKPYSQKINACHQIALMNLLKYYLEQECSTALDLDDCSVSSDFGMSFGSVSSYQQEEKKVHTAPAPAPSNSDDDSIIGFSAWLNSTDSPKQVNTVDHNKNFIHAFNNFDFKKIKTALQSNQFEIRQINNMMTQKGKTLLDKLQNCIIAEPHIVNAICDKIMALKPKDLREFINKKDNIGYTYLHFACRTQNLKMVKFCVTNRWDIEAKDRNGFTPLDMACMKTVSMEDNLEIVQCLLKHSTDINNIDNIFGDTPLHRAVVFRQLPIVQLLVDNNADINIQNKNKKTALDRAHKHNYNEIIEFLQNAGGKRGTAPAPAPSNSDDDSIIGFSAWLNSTDSPKQVNTVDHNKNFINAFNNFDFNKIETALQSNQFDIRQINNMMTQKGKTLLDTLRGYVLRKPEILNAICDKIMVLETEDLKEFTDKKNGFGETYLYLACKMKSLNMVEFCIKNGWDVNGKDNMGFTPLHIACQNNSLKIVQFLLDNGADINNNDNKLQRTPLHRAVLFNELEIVRFLLDNGADVNIKNEYGLTALKSLGPDVQNEFNNKAKIRTLLEKYQKIT